MQAILSRQRAETLSSVLYPDDRTYQGKELRLKQQHFFVSATIQARGPVASRCPRANNHTPNPNPKMQRMNLSAACTYLIQGECCIL